jgi:A/G-specific adenine glycosylase
VKTTRTLLLDWYRKHRRDLPWRRTRDPYAIWISEAMLQQTRVETVIPYYERFLERFPDVQALASCDSDDLLGIWAGLGYYSRARNLRKAANVVVERHGGELPDSVEALRELPGIGRYTAGAVASIAFDKPEAIVDGNVARVLARVLDVRDDIAAPAVQKRLWAEAEALAQGPAPGDLNQALMELGATVCTPKSPSCGVCPVRGRCAGLAAGDPENLPLKTKKPKPRAVEGVAGWVERRGKVLAVRRPPHGLLGGLWELPGGELAAKEAPEAGMQRALHQAVGLRTPAAERLGSVEHLFTHRRLRLHVLRCDTPVGRVRLDGFDTHRWVAPNALAELPHGAPTKKALRLLAGAETGAK